MKRLVLGASGLALCSSPALAARFTMQLNPGPQQISRMQSGVAAVDDSTPSSSVRLIQAEGDLKKRGAIRVLVMNQGDKPFNFGPENITAKLADGTPVAIITYEQLVKEEKRRETWRAIAVGLAAASNNMNASRAGYYSGTATYSGSTSGTFGTMPYNSSTFGTATVSGYNGGQAAAAQSVANEQNEANFARMAQENAANMEALKAYMRTTTVDPQQMFGGSVTFELPKLIRQSAGEVSIEFVVTTGREQHTFKAALRRD